MIAIIDYGAGNLRSIINKIERIGSKAIATSKPEVINKAEKIILPGIGYFAAGMENLKQKGLIKVLNQKVLKDKTPILGICLGVQFFTDFSEEGNAKGLGWIKAKTVKFSMEKHPELKIPHMGWNTLNLKKKSKLFEDVEEDARFYFVHTYHLVCEDKTDILASTNYGYEFTSVIEKGNIYGTQFHPEKSHHNGIQIIRNFMEKI